MFQTVHTSPQMESIIDNPLATAGDVDSYVNELRGLADVQIAKHFSASAQRYKRGRCVVAERSL